MFDIYIPWVFLGGREGWGDYKITPTKPYRILLMELDNYVLFRFLFIMFDIIDQTKKMCGSGYIKIN